MIFSTQTFYITFINSNKSNEIYVYVPFPISKMRVQILNNGLSTPTSTNTELLISDMIPTQLPFAINFNFQPIETIFTTPIYIQGTYRFERTNLPSNFISSTAYLLIFEFFEKK